MRTALGISSGKSVTPDKLFQYNTTRPVYFTLTVSPDLLKSRSVQLYCTGLAMKHSAGLVENIPSLTYNWESLFTKNNLHQGESINKNYLLPMLLLKNQYDVTGQTQKAEEIKLQIEQIANRFALSQTAKKHID